MRNANEFSDETPTPSVLLKHCQEVGIFKDLGFQPDPFEEQFRRATQLGGSTDISGVGVKNQEPLNTPRVLLSSEVHFPLPAASILDTGDISKYRDSLPELKAASVQNVSEINPSPVAIQELDFEDLQQLTVPATTQESTVIGRPAVVQSGHQTVIKTPVIVRKTLLKSNTTRVIKPAGIVPGVVDASTSQRTIYSSTAPDTASTTVIPILPLQGASGQPVKTKAPLVQVIVNVDGQPMSFNTQQQHLLASSTSNTKFWTLCNVINTPSKSSILASNRTDVAAFGSTVSSTQNKVGLHNSAPDVIVQDTTSTVQPLFKNETCCRKRRGSCDSPQEQRRKFLERNKAAAFRSRKKKKKWIDDLVTKCKDLTDQNTYLQKELGKVRNEVARLKGLLLSHKNCSVSQELRKAGQMACAQLGN